MAPGGDGDFELGADAVVGGDQERVLVTSGLEVEKAAKTAQIGIRARSRRRGGEGLDGLHKPRASVDIDARLAVSVAVAGLFAHWTGAQ